MSNVNILVLDLFKGGTSYLNLNPSEVHVCMNEIKGLIGFFDINLETRDETI